MRSSLQLGHRVTENGLKGFVTFVCNPPQKNEARYWWRNVPITQKKQKKNPQWNLNMFQSDRILFLFTSTELMHFSVATSKRMQDTTVGGRVGAQVETCETGSWGQHSARPLFRWDFFLLWRTEEDHRGRMGRGSSYGTADLLGMAFPSHQPSGFSHEQKRQPREDDSPPTARVTV